MLTFRVLVLLAFIFSAQISVTSSAIHFNDKSFYYNEKDSQFVLSESNETQLLDGYFLLDSGEPLKLKFETFNFTEINDGEQEITFILNASLTAVKLQLKYIPKKLIIDIEEMNNAIIEYNITYSCTSICNQTFEFEITSSGVFHSFYNKQERTVDLNTTLEGEKDQDGKEKFYFNFEWSSNNTVDFLVTASHAKSYFGPHYLPYPNPSYPENKNTNTEVKNYKTSIWMWILLILALAAFGIFTTFLCVMCRLSPPFSRPHPPRPFATSTSSDDFDL